jgi:hypothetical protein
MLKERIPIPTNRDAVTVKTELTVIIVTLKI